MKTDITSVEKSTPIEEGDNCDRDLTASSMVWIVFKYGYPSEFQGVFFEKSRAIEACRTSDHCICPAIMDQEITQITEDWNGAYYPRLQDDPKNVSMEEHQNRS